MTDQIPDVPLEPERRNLLQRASVVWLVPIIAVLIALFVAWQNYADRGPLIEITFQDASGIQAGETELRYRDVTVGVVEDVSFSDSLDEVLVSVRLDENRIAPFVDESARFWVVQPEVTTQGVSGLDTVLSGVFIEGVWDTDPGGLLSAHRGLSEAPLLRAGQAGIVIKLRASAGTNLTRSAPILFKGIEVGRIGTPVLLPGGAAAETDAVIFEPYDSLVTTATRFWDVSGFSFTLGAGGAELDFSSVASLISGGVTFETILSGGAPAVDGTVFEVFPDEAAARDSLFSDNSGPALNLAVIFDDNVSGLTTGAPVELRGVQIGSVTSVTGIVDPERFNDERVHLLAILDIFPGQMGVGEDSGTEDALSFLEERVAAGLRARLATASLLTGGLKVELIALPGAAPATLDRAAEPFPIIPSVEAEVSGVSASAQGVLQRISDLPIEEVLTRVSAFLEAATRLVGNDELGRVPGEVTALLGEVRDVVGAPGIQGAPEQVASVLTRAETVLAEIEDITESPALAALPDDISGLVGEARQIVGAPGLQTLPETLQRLGTRLEDTAEALDTLVNDPATQSVPSEALGLLQDTRRIVGSEALQAMPDRTLALVDDLNSLAASIARLAEDPATTRIPAATLGLVEDARTVVAAPGVQDLPERIGPLADGLSDTVASLNALIADPALGRIPGQVSGVLDDVRGITSAPGTQGIPENAGALVSELRAVTGDLSSLVDDLREAQTAQRLSAALDAATVAAEDVSESVDGVPALVQRLTSVAESADELPLEEVVATLNETLATARNLLAQDTTQALPETLGTALDEIGAVLSELRTGGAIDNVNRTLASAQSASKAIETAAQSLPELSARLDRLLVQAGTTLSGFDASSELVRSTRRALREVEDAAAAVRSFARALERNPNSLILGR